VRDVEGQAASRPIPIEPPSSAWSKMSLPDASSRMSGAFSPSDGVPQCVDGYSVASVGLMTLATAGLSSFERYREPDGQVRERPRATQCYSSEIESQIGLTMPTSPEDDLTPGPSDSRCSITNCGYMSKIYARLQYPDDASKTITMPMGDYTAGARRNHAPNDSSYFP